MNCKPNQRAMLTRPRTDFDRAHMGMVFTVRSIQGVHPIIGPIWHVDPDNRTRVPHRLLPIGTVIVTCADQVLTPLPDDPEEGIADTQEKALALAL